MYWMAITCQAFFYHVAADESRVGAHAHDVLIIVVVRYAVYIVWHGERLTFRRGGCGGKLTGLHPVVQSQFPQVEEWRRYAVDTVVEEIVQLSFGVIANRVMAIFTLSSSSEM